MFPLRARPKKGGSIRQLDEFVDQFNPDAVEPVAYVVQNILKKRLVDGEEQYYVKWAGWRSSENTWEPKQNLTDYGADEYVKEFEEKQKALEAICLPILQSMGGGEGGMPGGGMPGGMPDMSGMGGAGGPPPSAAADEGPKIEEID